MQDMSREEALAFLADQPVGHLAVVDDGEPYVTPISFVLLDDVLYFRTGPGRRLTVLRGAPRVCVEASAVTGEAWDSAIIWGDAAIVEDMALRADVVTALLAKYREAVASVLVVGRGPSIGDDSVVVGVTIDAISGRSSGRDLEPRLRPGRL